MPADSRRSRGHRTDDDGGAGTWRRRNDGPPSDVPEWHEWQAKMMQADCDDRDGCPACGLNDGTHREGCSLPSWRPVVLQHEVLARKAMASGRRPVDLPDGSQAVSIDLPTPAACGWDEFWKWIDTRMAEPKEGGR